MGKQWTNKDYMKFVEDETVGFRVIGKYVNNSTKVLMYHEDCGREFEIRPADFKRRKRCSPCNLKRKISTPEYKIQVKTLSDDQYEVLEEYVNDSTKILMRHKACQYEWRITPSHFKQGKRCPKCLGLVRKDTPYFKNEVFELVGDEYEVRSEYIKAHSKVEFKHRSDKCGGHVFMMAPTDFLMGKRCPSCADIARSGENHWNYNPDLTEEDRQRRDMQNGEIRKWRDLIYERDEYTCRKCGEVGGRLNAHHLNSWDAYEEERFDLDNGVTLCNKCHISFHREFGYGNNTVTQFEEFESIA